MTLTDIAVPVSADTAVLHLHPLDNVAIARTALPAGQLVRTGRGEVRLLSAVPAGHKIALAVITSGASIRRYGEVIGSARLPIRAGEHVHTHNVVSREVAVEYQFPSEEVPAREPRSAGRTFLGYLRRDGRTGTRNYIAVAAASNCAAHVVDCIANEFRAATLPAGVDGVVAFPHSDGCGHAVGPDTRQLQRTLAGLLDHPNVAGAVIVGLGCEVNFIEQYLSGTRETEHLSAFTIQESGGTRATVQAAAAAVKQHVGRAAAMARVEVPVSKITLALNCGGSDSFSGVTANPALGRCADLLGQAGGTAVLAETPEIFGAEHLLVRRARNRHVAEALLACIETYKTYLAGFGCRFDDNPAPGNRDGGLTNIVEKSLGAVEKSGSLPLMGVVDYAARVSSPGLVFMNTPGYDPVSLTGLAAGGANVIAFTTGRGSAIGFPTLPVIKIAASTTVFQKMRDNMDFNAGRILDGEVTVEQAGMELFEYLVEVASGRCTASERLGHREFVPWRIGPVL